MEKIDTIAFNNPRMGAVGIDVVSLQTIRAQAPATLAAPQRVEFCFLMLVQEGSLRHTVDFVDYELEPGSVVFLRPGQVQRWHMQAQSQVQGWVVLLSEQVLAPPARSGRADSALLRLEEWPHVARIATGPFARAIADIRHLYNETMHFSAAPGASAIVWHLAMVLLLRLADALKVGEEPTVAAREWQVYRLFCKELEAGFQQRLTVRDLALRLGWSQSTLTRACLASVGQSAKTVIDQRTVLEAKRMLVHSDITAAAIGHHLGFAEPTNFVKFFRRMTGTTPQDYRNAMAAAL